MKKAIIILVMLVVGVFVYLSFYTPPLPENHGKVDTQLFLGTSDQQPLVVAFGGSEGGNTWAREDLKEIRDKFLQQGYAFLAIGYFGTSNTPAQLDRISINAIHDTIVSVSQHPKINQEKIALLGGSRGGELVLNLASRYQDVGAVVAIVPAHVSFPAITARGNTSSWTFHEVEVPYVPVSYRTIPAAIKNDWLRMFEIMLENEEEVSTSAIEVEKINGSIFLLSAKNDEVWPSTYMSDGIMNRLTLHNFQHYYEHFSYDGGHTASKQHLDLVLKFLDEHFK